MPLTPTQFAGAGSGWTNSANITAFDGVFATASCVRTFEPDPTPHYIAPPSASLLASTFGLSIGAGDTVNGIEVEIRIKQDGGIPSLQGVIWLARGGVQVGSAKIFSVDTVLTSIVFGGAADAWGGAWNGSELSGLQVVLYVQGVTGTGTAVLSCDGVRANATYTGSTPNPFTFTDINGATQSTQYVSNTITISGITSSVPVTTSGGGEYEKNSSGIWTASPGTAVNGDTFRVRITSSASANTAVNQVLTVGGVSDTYTVTTAAVDTTPDAFGWATVYGATPSSPYTSSDAVTVSGINAAAAISIVGGTYSKNGAAFTAAAGTVVAGDTVRVALTTSASFSTTNTATVTIGGVAGTYDVVTRAADTTPDAFTFTDVAGATPAPAVYTSNQITVAGIEAAAALTFGVSGGTVHEYQIGAGAWTAVGATTIDNGQQLRVRMTSPGGANQAGNITVTIGGVSDTYSVSTGADTIPDQFTFTDVTQAIASVVYTSNQVTIAGMTAAVPVTATVVGGEFQIGAGAWVTTADVVNGDQITVRGTAPAIPGSTQDVVFTLGGVSDTFSITSRAAIAQDF